MSPRISVVTCTRDSMPWLRQSVDSVLAQDWPEIDYVFVDGDSTDGTLDLIRSIPRPVTVVEGACAGISDAMNRGLAAASGDVVGFLHADDWYLRDDALSIVAQGFGDGAGNPRWLFGRTMRAVDGRLLPEGFRAPDWSRRRLLRGNFIPHPAAFVERTLLLEAGGFDVRLRYAMDYDLWLRISPLAEPLQLGMPLAAFREHEGSLSTRDRLAAMREDLQVRLRHAGRNPLQRALHLARYAVRRRRAQRLIAGGLDA